MMLADLRSSSPFGCMLVARSSLAISSYVRM